MKWTFLGSVFVALTVVAIPFAARAQSTAKKDAKEMMYTGCVEGTTGHFMLNHAMMEPAKGKDTVATSGTKEKEKELTLTSTAVDLSKHVGHKVTVTGAANNEKEPFMVKSLKMVSSKCS